MPTRNRLDVPLASYGRFRNRLAEAQSAPGGIYDVARSRRHAAFEREADRRFRELQQYGRELSGWERASAALPQSDPEGVRETLTNVMGAQFAGGVAGAVLDDPINAVRNLANPRVPSNVIPATVYHGSPHRINNVTADAPYGRFDVEKIGTGEGGAAFGHGLYLAEHPATARVYMRPGEHAVPTWNIDGVPFHTNTTMAGSGAGNRAAAALDRYDGDKALAIRWLEGSDPMGAGAIRERDEAITMLRSAEDVSRETGHFYTVDLPDEQIANMLDWDAPLSEQPEGVRAAFNYLTGEQSPLTGDYRRRVLDLVTTDMPERGMPTGEDLVTLLGADNVASDVLREAGIPGIRYYDAGSRAAGEGTRNFVIFDPDTVRIMGRE